MFLGALLDAGFPLSELIRQMGSLPLEGYRLEARTEGRKHIHGTRFQVHLQDHHAHPHRTLKDIRALIHQGDLKLSVREKSVQIFETLARVEGAIHQVPFEEVHFHEVGAVDSIVDIVGTVLALDELHIHRLYASAIPVGSGFVSSAHGRLPVPAPAAIAILTGIPLVPADIPYEMVTPTGAALLKELVSGFGAMPAMVVHTVAYGVGAADFPDRPNLLRLLIGEEGSTASVETVVVLEANVDDMSPEWLGFLMERLFQAGALDVAFLPIQMKKNRPATQIQVMGRPDQQGLLTDILLRESTSLGVRFRYCQRKIVDRVACPMESPWGRIMVKKVSSDEGSPFLAPEYEDCRRIALQHKIPLKEVYGWVQRQGVVLP